jgi:hypothetical protein
MFQKNLKLLKHIKIEKNFLNVYKIKKIHQFLLV